MTSPAYKAFYSVYARGYATTSSSVKLWQVINDTESSREPTIEEYNEDTMISDMGRAGIVISVSAFDDYFTNRFTECVVPILKKEGASKKLSGFLEEAGIDVATALKFLSSDRPYRRIRNIVGNYLGARTWPAADSVDTH